MTPVLREMFYGTLVNWLLLLEMTVEKGAWAGDTPSRA